MTTAQIKAFWPVFARHCDALGIERPERDAYKRRRLTKLFGTDSLHEVGKTGEFETLMSTMLAEAGDYEQASKFAIGDIRRMSRLINDVARQVFELKGLHESVQCDWLAYCLGILDRMGYRQVRTNSQEWWMDIGVDRPIKIFQALDTHRRRLVKRLYPEASLAYRFGEEWK